MWILSFGSGHVNTLPARSEAGRSQSGWCPVDAKTFESSNHPSIHVIGDSAIAGKLPKSASAANSEAKVCAAAIADLLAGRAVGEPSFVNACYSLVAPSRGISPAAVYGLAAEGISPVPESFGTSPLGASNKYRQKEARDAEDWYKNVVADSIA